MQISLAKSHYIPILLFISLLLILVATYFRFIENPGIPFNKKLSPNEIQISQLHPYFSRLVVSDALQKEIIVMRQADSTMKDLPLKIELSDIPQKIQINAGGDRSWSYSYSKDVDSHTFKIGYNPTQPDLDKDQLQSMITFILMSGLCEQILMSTQPRTPLHERIFACEPEIDKRISVLSERSSSSLVSLDLN